MGADSSERKKREAGSRIRGAYAPVPVAILDSGAYRQASFPARALLLELLRQWDYGGEKNGHYHLATPWLEKRGWKSRETIQRARQELIDLELIIETRKGGLNRGPSRYAVTWHSIKNFEGLDLLKGDYAPGAYAKKNKLTVPTGGHVRTDWRSGSGPPSGHAKGSTGPIGGPKRTPLPPLTVPPIGHNEIDLPLQGGEQGEGGAAKRPRERPLRRFVAASVQANRLESGPALAEFVP